MKPGKVLLLASLDTNIVLSHYFVAHETQCFWFLPLNQSLKEQIKLLDSIDHELTGRLSRLYTYFSLT